MRPSYLYNGNCHTGKTTYSYWEAPRGPYQYKDAVLHVREILLWTLDNHKSVLPSVLRQSYLHSGKSYTGKAESSYWNVLQGAISIYDNTSYCKILKMQDLCLDLYDHSQKFDRHLSSGAAEVPVQSDAIIQTTNLMASRLHEILRYDVLSDIEMRLRFPDSIPGTKSYLTWTIEFCFHVKWFPTGWTLLQLLFGCPIILFRLLVFTWRSGRPLRFHPLGTDLPRN